MCVGVSVLVCGVNACWGGGGSIVGGKPKYIQTFAVSPDVVRQFCNRNNFGNNFVAIAQHVFLVMRHNVRWRRAQTLKNFDGKYTAIEDTVLQKRCHVRALNISSLMKQAPAVDSGSLRHATRRCWSFEFFCVPLPQASIHEHWWKTRQHAMDSTWNRRNYEAQRLWFNIVCG